MPHHYIVKISHSKKASDMVNFIEEKDPGALKKVESNLLTGKVEVYLHMEKYSFHSLAMMLRHKFGRRCMVFEGFTDEQWAANKDIRFCPNT